MHAVKRRRELLLIWRPSGLPIVRRSRIVVYFAQRNSMAAPTAFELAVIVVDQNTLVIDDVDFFCILVQIEKEYPARKYLCLLIILLQRPHRLALFRPWAAMAEIP